MQKSFSSFEQGDIVTVELPFSDYSKSKLRPVLVASSGRFNSKSGDLIVLKITGTKHRYEYCIELTNKEMDEGELRKTSYVDAGFIMTIEKTLVGNRIARVRKEFMEKVKDKLESILLQP